MQLAHLMQGSDWPNLGDTLIEGGQATISMTIGEDVRWFQGHFPEQAVLPGVVQVHWAAKLAKVVFSELTVFSSVKNLKFKTVILPHMNVDLVLNYNQDKKFVSFSYKQDDQVYSAGILVFV